MSEQDVSDASRQVVAARGEAVAASTERSAALSEAFSRGLAKLRSSRTTSGSTSSSFEQIGESLNRLDQISKSVANSTGLSQSQVANIAFGAAGHLGLGGRAGPVSAGLEADARAQKSYLSGLTAQEQKVLGSMTSEQLSEFKQFGDRVSRDTSLIALVASDSREAREMASRLSSTVARSSRADATLSERTAFAERVSTAHERGEVISIDIAQDPHNIEMFTRFAEQYGGDSAAAHSLMSSELARRSLVPNRQFTDGTALPVSFGEIRGEHQRQRADPELGLDVSGVHRADQQTTMRFGSSEAMQPNTPAASPIRDEIRSRRQEVRSQADSDQAGFDAKSEVISTEDGTLASRKSLLKQSAKQVKEDAGATYDNAKEAVRDLLKRK